MEAEAFVTLAGPGEAQTRIRGSRFEALAYPASNEDEARSVLAAREREQFDASHHCAAWRFRDGTWRAIDAGEPSGSAGAPILAAIDGFGFLDAAVVVTRYFGGTKLGIGGLIRAYGEAAADALSAAPKRRGHMAVRARIRYAYDYTSTVMRAVERVEAHEVEHGYAAGEAQVDFTVPRSGVEPLRAFLTEQSAGSLDLQTLRETVLYIPGHA